MTEFNMTFLHQTTIIPFHTISSVIASNHDTHNLSDGSSNVYNLTEAPNFNYSSGKLKYSTQHIMMNSRSSNNLDGGDLNHLFINGSSLISNSTLFNITANNKNLTKIIGSVIGASNNRNAAAAQDANFQNNVIVPLYAVIFFLSVIGNFLVIFTLTQNKRMRTVTNVYLLNLVSKII